MKTKTILLIVAGIFIGILFSFTEKYFASDNENLIAFKENIKVFAVNLPQNPNFAGETVPINRFYVKEALEREITVNAYFHSASILIIKKANRWFPVIEPILKKHNIPDDFKYLAVAESALENVVSPAGASGFWQLMKTTAKEYNLEVNEDIDQRFDIELATEVACKYLINSYKKYGNWTMVAASYNAGMGRIDNELQKQKHNDYYDMNFGIETGRYIYRIIALKAMLENPTDYGFYIRSEDKYKAFQLESIIIDSAINDLPSFAKKYNLTYKEFKIYNPWIKQVYLANASGKKYRFQLPQH
jgi:hypothetical protein